MNILLVDGYNMIGAWEPLKQLKVHDIGQARDKLLDILSEYQVYTRDRIIVVFDALYVKGMESKKKLANLEIIYTKEDETADECIEGLIRSVKNVKNQVYVATSDYMEQRTVFQRGALRISARELWIDIQNMDAEVEEQLSIQKSKQPRHKLQVQDHILSQLEKWRRGQS